MKLIPLNWTAPKKVDTSRGPRLLRVADPDAAFWTLWKSHKQALKTAGYSVTKKGGVFQVNHWAPETTPEIKPETPSPSEAFEQSRALDSDIEVPLSRNAKERGFDYFGFQKAGIERIVENAEKPEGENGTLLGDDMGVGKTIQQLGAINYLKAQNALLVCPAAMLLGWAQEAFVWLADEDIPIYLVTAQKAKLDEARFPGINDRVTITKEWPEGNRKIVIINYDILHKHQDALRERVWDYVGFDESHYAKNTKSRRTKMCFGGRV